MAPTPPSDAVYKALHRPLTLCGVERRLFFVALLVGAASFNLFYSLLAGLLTFTLLYVAGRWSTSRDPQMLRILFTAAQRRHRYDPAKHAPFIVSVREC